MCIDEKMQKGPQIIGPLTVYKFKAFYAGLKKILYWELRKFSP